jgi:putative ABC transport system ATP-binding protein
VGRLIFSEGEIPNVAIQASALVKWFGEGEAKTMALNEVNLEAQFGEMVYIVGPLAHTFPH